MFLSSNSWKDRTRLPNYRFWIAWSIAIVIVFVVHLLTLTISLPIWQDEVQIIEYGRLTLEPQSDWSLNWSVLTNKPIYLFSYLGVILQELAFRASNLSMVGPRLASLLGAIIAATAFLGWLLSRKTPKRVAWILALIFLLEPLFVQSYRGARVDCWVFALCFASCWMLRLAMERIQNGQRSIWLVTLAGSLTAANIFVWPSAVLLYPLVIVELVELIQRVQTVSKDWKTSLSQIILFAVGAGITAILLVIPIWWHITRILSDLQLIGSADKRLNTETEIISALKNTLFIYKFNPLLPIIVLIGFIFSHENKLRLTTLFLLVFIVITRSYALRVIYLSPYILCLFGGIFQYFEQKRQTKIHRRIASSLLILLLTWSIVLSLVVRPVMVLSQKEGRNPQLIYNAGISSIGTGSHKVYLDVFPFYYVGRSLGWKMFLPFGFPFDRRSEDLQQGNDVKFRQLLSSVDYAIVPQNITPEMISLIEEAGLRYQKTLVNSAKNDYINEKVKQFIIPPYGPYMLYIR
ncbi:hypothetical protein ACE1AT_28890 [Pelatocladus sp. BLCC-F211]|uniref:hypothetical protein n=1 Tax=Pelatocladus sp. BLCC-F211 TaxID=3342752 RepID=UPI0035B9F3DB